MNKKDLIELGIAEDVAEKVVVLHGKDIEAHKTKLTETQSQFNDAKSQLENANKQIADFKKMDIESIQKAAADWETKYKEAETNATAQLANLKFNHALDGALTTAKAKNPKAVKALLDMETLKKAYDEKTESIIGFDEHLKPVKEANDYLFADSKEPPKIVTGGTPQPITGSAFLANARKAAGLPEPK